MGSQGTLGIVTQVKLKTAPYNPQTSLLAGFFDNIDKAADAVDEMQKLGPSCMEMVDDHLLDFVSKHNPSQLKGIIEKPYPKIAVLIEFDDMNDRTQKSKARRAKKILAEMAYEYRLTRDTHEQQSLWKLRHSAAAVLWHTAGNSKALPIIEDGVVPKEGFTEYLNRVYALYQKHGLDVAVWGHAGDANLHMQPFLDLSKVGDRQKVFRIADEYYNMVLEMGGSTSGEHNDARMRAPYLPRVYGKEMYELFRKVKKIFDPMNTMNPGVKIDVDRADLVPMLRREYSMKHLYDHLPKS